MNKILLLAYKTIHYDHLTWSWKEFGNGPRLMLAFHGFNRSPDDFLPFAKELGARYTLLAFDLFFHGRSGSSAPVETTPLSHGQLRELIDAVLKTYQAREFEVMAYSFGGRLALNCVEIFKDRVKGIYLMAPDGLRMNPGFWLATQTAVGRALFKRYLTRPEGAIRLMQWLSKRGWYPPKAMNTYINHMIHEQVRTKVYHCWLFHRRTVPDLKNISDIISRNPTTLHLFFGKYDVVIPPATGRKFAERCRKPRSLHILEIGHRVTEKHADISQILLEEPLV